jgi:transposase
VTTLSVDLRERILASYDAHKGTRKEIASRYLVSLGMVKKLLQQRRKTGDIRPRHKNSGRPRRLSIEQLETLRELLSQGATAHGWCNDLWTSKRVVEVIRRRFNIACSIGGGYHILTRYLGWSPQRPVAQLRERDNVQIETWRTEKFVHILAEAAERNASVVFVDESGFQLAPTLRRTFAPRGSRPVVKVSDPHGRISAIGAITIDPPRRNLGVLYQFLPDNANFNGYLVVQFAKQVCSHIAGPVTIVWDSIPIHSKRLMEEYLEKNKGLKIEQFPPYAPELNPIDKLWAYLKYARLANYTPSNLTDLRARLVCEINELVTRQDVLAGCIRAAGLASALD